MKDFDYYAPTCISEVLNLLENSSNNTFLIAGGTDIILAIKSKNILPEVIVDIKQIKELNFIKEENGFIRIGSATPFSVIAESELIKTKAKGLAMACNEVGSTQIRNLGTLGGNIASGSACADGVSALVAFDAYALVKSPNGERRVKVEDIYKDAYPVEGCCGCSKTDNKLKKNEIITEIYFKTPKENVYTGFRKLGKRKALAKSVLTFTAVIEVENKKCVDAKLSLGAVGRNPYRANKAEEILNGNELTIEVIDKCVDKISEIVVDNIGYRSSCEYKKESVKGIAREILINIYNEIME